MKEIMTTTKTLAEKLRELMPPNTENGIKISEIIAHHVEKMLLDRAAEAIRKFENKMIFSQRSPESVADELLKELQNQRWSLERGS